LSPAEMEMKPEELRKRIEGSGVSGRQIARALGVERAQPSKWCRGVKPTPSGTFREF
jgi:transcriptional regulator with XRE-family HTH domain